MSFIEESVYFGIILSLLAYGLGVLIKSKFKKAIFNPLLISIAITIAVLVVSDIDYETYNEGANILTWLLTPATVCLAVPLYEKISLLRDNWKAIFAGITTGVLTSLVCILLMAILFGFSHEEYVTFLPKSITTAIGIGVSEEMGGYTELTAAIIIITGVVGNVIAPFICKVGKITEPIAKGIAIGTSAHAVGTARALEMGETEGAMSSLSIGVAGILTVIGASIFAQFM
ncbi:MAG: LrgB family protein [Agathobacter sp.]|nr:LrgB family protein [Agathobacter sp.]